MKTWRNTIMIIAIQFIILVAAFFAAAAFAGKYMTNNSCSTLAASTVQTVETVQPTAVNSVKTNCGKAAVKDLVWHGSDKTAVSDLVWHGSSSSGAAVVYC